MWSGSGEQGAGADTDLKIIGDNHNGKVYQPGQTGLTARTRTYTGPMPAQGTDPGRDYIVEYRTGQFQNGSLVLRFPTPPTDSQLRAALINYGLPAAALEQVRARPLASHRPWEHIRPDSRRPSLSPSSPPPGASPAATQLPDRKKRGGSWLSLLIFLVVVLFTGLALRAQPAIETGTSLGTMHGPQGAAATACFESLNQLGMHDRRDLTEQFLSRTVTGFTVTPANAAFYLSCLDAARQ